MSGPAPSPLEVLVVDDNAMNIELVQFILEAAGHRVRCAADAAQARAAITAQRPDAILMDIQLPGMDGLALTHALKADAATRQIVVIAFTAYAMKGDEARLRAEGCDGYLAKPIEVALFAAQVEAIVVAQRASPTAN
jgi:CheY-like chemotaxis protein